MSKIEFMAKLEQLLTDIAPGEREEALQYYRDYFDDAGVENEELVIRELGSPEQVAENIRNELKASNLHVGEAKAEDHQVVEYGRSAENYESVHSSDGSFSSTYATSVSNGASAKTGMPTWAIVLCTVVAVLTAPVWIPLAIAAVVIVIAVIVTVLAVFLAIGAVAIALIVAFFAAIIGGIATIVVAPLAGLAVIGVGFVCGAFGVGFLMLTVLLFGVVLPAIVKGIGSLFEKK